MNSSTPTPAAQRPLRRPQKPRKRLTDTAVRNLTPNEKPYKVYDSGGLYLLVSPSGPRTPKGSKAWRFKYRFAGHEKLLSLGVYPDVKLSEARKRRNDARAKLAADPPVDPAAARREEKAARGDSFKAVATDWFDRNQADYTKQTRQRNQLSIDRMSERFGKTPISKITPPDVKAALLSIQSKFKAEAAHRAHGVAANVFAFAIADGKALVDPTAGLRNVLKKRTTTHRSALTEPKKVGELMRKIYAFEGQPSTRAFLQLLALNFPRPGKELRFAKWPEFDLDADDPVWVIPVERMKMRRKNPAAHLVPLANQSVAILSELHELAGEDDWVFPTNKPDTPLSENAANNALRSMGYGGNTHTAHGFRSTASTLLHEFGFPPEVIETQLAHARGSVSGVYNRSHLLAQRREMLQSWADYLDQLRKGAGVVAINARKN